MLEAKKYHDELGEWTDIVYLKPDLDDIEKWYHSVFQDLSITRSPGFDGPSPISIQAIHSYCDGFGIFDLDEREDLVDIIISVDAEYIALNTKD